MQCISRRDKPRSIVKDRQVLDEEAVLTNGENCDMGINHDLLCGQKDPVLTELWPWEGPKLKLGKYTK